MGVKPVGMKDVELHIEELVLHGFSPGSRQQIGDAVQRELTRLIAEQGLAGLEGASVEIERINGGKFQVGQGATPQSLGAQVANTIHRQFARGAGREPRDRRGAQLRTPRSAG